MEENIKKSFGKTFRNDCDRISHFGEERLQYYTSKRKEIIHNSLLKKRLKGDISEQKQSNFSICGKKKVSCIVKSSKKGNRGNRKKCWICGSLCHLKRTCPYVRCFVCGKSGHIKKDCLVKQIKILHGVLDYLLDAVDSRFYQKMENPIFFPSNVIGNAFPMPMNPKSRYDNLRKDKVVDVEFKESLDIDTQMHYVPEKMDLVSKDSFEEIENHPPSKKKKKKKKKKK